MLAFLKLRHLLVGLLGLMALISLIAIALNISTLRESLRHADWIAYGNDLADIVLRSSSNSGMERGLTVMLLSSARDGSPPENTLSRLERLRESDTSFHAGMLEQVQRLEQVGHYASLQEVMAHFRQMRQRLLEARVQVDACLSGEVCHLGTDEWLDAINGYIDALAMLRRAALGKHSEPDHSYADNPIIKEVLYTLTEYTGRERALIGGVIAEGRPFTAAEMDAIHGYRGVIGEARQKIDTIVRRLSQEQEIAAAHEALRQEFDGRFEVLRRQVYAASMREETYPVTAAQWFDAATAAIDTIATLAERLAAHTQDDVRLMRRQALQNVVLFLVSAALVILVLLYTVFVMRRRALLPLRRLEHAAHVFGSGELHQPLTGFDADELGEVAAAFESMRGRLLDQIRERELAEAQLRLSMQRFRSLVENINDVMWEVDDQCRYTYISPQIRNILGYEPGEVLGRSPMELMSPEQRETVQCRVSGLLQRPESYGSFAYATRHKDGSLVVLESSGMPIFDEGGAFLGYRGVSRDITQRKQAEEETNRLLRVVEQTDDMVIITDPAGMIEYVNPAFERITGYGRDEALGRYTRLLKSGQHDAAFYQNLWRTISSGDSFHAKMIDRRKNGELFHTEHTISPLRDGMGRITHYVCTAKDVTERHRLDEQLQQSEKLASIGQLAAGVAHEINNPVGYISSNIGSLNRYLDDLFRLCDAYGAAETALAEPAVAERLRALRKELDFEYLRGDIQELLKESAEGVNRVKKIVQDLKDFSRQETAEWQLADLHKGLESTLNIVNNELKYKAEVVREYGELPEIECVPSQLNQVFMNLLVNAAHAIEQHGTITVRTGREGEQVWVEVEDTGKGIAPEHTKRIFEPFFTTKPVGKGTGLGLSLSYGIVQKHGGRIELDSAAGRGTRFRVWLPVRQLEHKAE